MASAISMNFTPILVVAACAFVVGLVVGYILRDPQ